MNYEKLKSAAKEYATSPTGDVCEKKVLSFIEGAEWAREYYLSKYFTPNNIQPSREPEDWTPIDPNTGMRDRRVY